MDHRQRVQEDAIGARRRSSLQAAIGAILGGRPGFRQTPGGSTIDGSAMSQPEATPVAAPASTHRSTPGIVDRDWMTPDYSTMSSQDNYTNLLNQDGVQALGLGDNVEYDSEFLESPLAADMNSQTKSKGRSKSFNEEDMLLVSAYLNVSKDPITGPDQKDG